MYFSTGYQANVETIAVLSGTRSRTAPNDPASLKRAYQEYTARLQPGLPRGRSEDVEFIDDPADLKRLARAFAEEPRLSEIRSALFLENFQDAPKRLEFAREAYSALRERCPEAGLLFQLVFNIVFALPCVEAGRGSSPSAVGVLWANRRPSWSENDMIEFLVHEMTHNLLYLDEHRFAHYADRGKTASAENWATSAVLGRPCPIDKSLHSLVVATEILLFRDEFTGHHGRWRVHPPSALLRDNALRCVESIMSLRNLAELCRPRVIELTLLCGGKLESLTLPRTGRHSFAGVGPR